MLYHRQLLCSIPRLSAPSCHLLGKISTMGTFFSMRHLCLQSKWPTMMEITDVLQRIMFPQRLFCPVDGGMVLRVQGQSTSCLWLKVGGSETRCQNNKQYNFYKRCTKMQSELGFYFKKEIFLSSSKSCQIFGLYL